MSINPDELYLRSREALLQYEDARLNSLLQAVANYYTTRNDQSIWGNFLRALAIELSKLEYDYAYDLVSKEPLFLTPPDIKRRWADPLYVTQNWPSKDQFDLDFKTMLVQLLVAYREGSTAKSIQDVIFAYTGKNIVVQELYKQIGTFFDQSDRNAIKVSVNVGGSDPLSDIQNLNQLQTITQSLYGAIDLAKPAHVGLEFTTVFGTDENLDCLLSPKYLTQQMFNTISTLQQAYYAPYAYVLTNPALFWIKSKSFALNLIVLDRNGNTQLVTTAGISGATEPTWNLTLNQSTSDGAVVWENIGPPLAAQITISQYQALAPTLQVLYQGLYLNSNCTGQGMDDTLRIFIREVELPPFDPMLIQAPVFDPANPETTVAAYGRKMAPQLSSAQFAALPSITCTITNTVADGTVATYTYASASQMLHESERLTIANCRDAFNLTGKIFNVTPNTFQLALAQTIASQAETGQGTVSPTIASGYTLTNGVYVLNSTSSDKLLTPASKWIMLLVNGAPTGEVSNWDVAHPMGLLAPRLDQVWEISGGDSDAQFVI